MEFISSLRVLILSLIAFSPIGSEIWLASIGEKKSIDPVTGGNLAANSVFAKAHLLRRALQGDISEITGNPEVITGQKSAGSKFR